MNRKNTASLLFLVSIASGVVGCNQASTQDDTNAVERSGLLPERVIHRPQMPKPPIPLEQLEAKIEKVCPIEIERWQRIYSYRWLHDHKRYSTEDLSFVFRRGAYDDFRPSRSWRDVVEVTQIDDRPGIEIIFGHFHLKTGKLEFEVGSCSPRG